VAEPIGDGIEVSPIDDGRRGVFFEEKARKHRVRVFEEEDVRVRTFAVIPY